MASIIVGTNSWVTIVEADAYLGDRIFSEKWFDLSDEGNPGIITKTSLLISAFRWLISSPLLTIPASSTDDNVKNAQMESGMYLFEHYREVDARRTMIATGVKEARMSRKTEILSNNPMTIPDHILGLLGAYITGTTKIIQLGGHYDV